MVKINKLISAFILSCISISLNAQNISNGNIPEPTDFMRSNGKIYVVMVVVVIILLGILVYLINLDRKISKLEKEV